jgi:hypothetical protein
MTPTLTPIATSADRVADRLPRWIRIWFLISLPVLVWDVTFVLLRPLSMAGGSLSSLWIPYRTYITVDLGYGDLDNGFVWAQAIMTAGEIAIALAALVLDRRRRLASATLLVFTVSVLTAAKTVLILLIELVTGGEHVGHNPLSQLVLMYLVPNGLWVVMPVAAAVVTGRRLLAGWRPSA